MPTAPIPRARGDVPASWMPDARMERVIVHWTAGRHTASGLDRRHYHILIEGDGGLVRGVPTIDLNARPVRPGYAAHTRNCNGAAIGVSLCGMAEAREAPFDAGPAPINPAQWGALAGVLADLCRRYGIAVTPETVLTHAEVQPTLKIRQRGKWDIARLPWTDRVLGARSVGDLMRSDLRERLN